MDVPRIDRSLGELFSDLSQQTAELIRQEMRLAKAELSEKAADAGRHLVVAGQRGGQQGGAARRVGRQPGGGAAFGSARLAALGPAQDQFMFGLHAASFSPAGTLAPPGLALTRTTDGTSWP